MPNVLVTGGTRGLGFAIARHLVARGYRVVAVARRGSAAFEAAAAESPGQLVLRCADLGDIAAIPALIHALTKEFGPWHGLVNNAGIGTSGVLATMRDADIETLLRVNIAAPIAVTKYMVRAMMVSGAGRIVNISSIVAATGYSGLSVYSASKAALSGFSRALAREVGPLGITVNCVAPGFIATDMTETMDEAERARIARRSALKRMAEPQDVAEAVAFLLGEGGRNVTGITVTVDAGNTV